MSETTQDILWFQFGASIDMLENAITACPDEVWSDQVSFYEFWYYAYHTLFYLDFYLSEPPDSDTFAPPAPFTRSELSADELPERVYTKAELLSYLEFTRQKCRARIAGLTDERMKERIKVWKKEYSVLEWLLYNMRHVQHHAAQLNLLLRQRTDDAPTWVSRTKHALED
jgi:DinB superfamily